MYLYITNPHEFIKYINMVYETKSRPPTTGDDEKIRGGGGVEPI
jgi:hypothetical protein